MLRYTLAIYLVFMLGAGPSFCCCTFTQFANRLASVCVVSEENTPDPTPPCCQCHQQPKDDASDEKPAQPEPTDSPANPEKCPCHQSQINFVAKQGAKADGAWLSQVALHFGHDEVVVQILQPMDDTASFETTLCRNNLSSFSGDSALRLLSVLQVMRC